MAPGGKEEADWLVVEEGVGDVEEETGSGEMIDDELLDNELDVVV
jgi:hypothetical protein